MNLRCAYCSVDAVTIDDGDAVCHSHSSTGRSASLTCASCGHPAGEHLHKRGPCHAKVQEVKMVATEWRAGLVEKPVTFLRPCHCGRFYLSP